MTLWIWLMTDLMLLAGNGVEELDAMSILILLLDFVTECIVIRRLGRTLVNLVLTVETINGALNFLWIWRRSVLEWLLRLWCRLRCRWETLTNRCRVPSCRVVLMHC